MSKGAILNKIRELCEEGKEGIAFEAVSRLAEDNPQEVGLQNLAAQLALKLEQYGKAISFSRNAVQLEPDVASHRHSLGLALHLAGSLEEAAKHFRLAVELGDFSARPLLGAVLLDSGMASQAKSHLEQALQNAPDDAEAWYLLGQAHAELSDHHSASAAFSRSLEVRPGHRATVLFRAASKWSAGDLTGALSDYECALALQEDLATLLNLSSVCRGLGKLERAEHFARRAIEKSPDASTAWTKLGDVLANRNSHQATAAYEQALTLDPDNAQTACNYGVFLSGQRKNSEALKQLSKAVSLQPELARAHCYHGILLRGAGRQDEAIASFEKALSLEPDSFLIRFCHCLSLIPLVYRNEAELAAVRAAYSEELRELVSSFNPGSLSPDSVIFPGMMQPFYLAYQGENDRELQKLYGQLIHNAQKLALPLPPPSPKKSKDDGRITVGIVSGYFHLHSNWKVPISGWLKRMERKRINLHCYYTGHHYDDITETARQFADRFIQNDQGWRHMARTISEDKPNVLIYPEIGMHPDTLRLAALRLAPVQCVSWGHPDTSGLPSMDHYLTSELMEPEDCVTHYTEKPVLLPGLSICYSPLNVTPLTKDKHSFGFNQNDTIYLCAQTLPKYLPQHDDIFPRIAKENPNSRFAFINSPLSSHITGVFRERLMSCFEQHGVDGEKHVVFLRHMGLAEYHALCRISDVMLDTLEWSGCNSLLEAIQHNVPALTLPGRLMRGRHGLAILEMLGCPELIAGDKDEYVHIAVRLGRDAGFRSALSARIRERKPLIYDDDRPASALEDFLVSVVDT